MNRHHKLPEGPQEPEVSSPPVDPPCTLAVSIHPRVNEGGTERVLSKMDAIVTTKYSAQTGQTHCINVTRPTRTSNCALDEEVTTAWKINDRKIPPLCLLPPRRRVASPNSRYRVHIFYHPVQTHHKRLKLLCKINENSESLSVTIIIYKPRILPDSSPRHLTADSFG